MRKIEKIAALCAAFALIVTAQACTGEGPDDTSDPETTSSPSATQADTPETFYDPPVTETGEIITPDTPTVFTILYSDASLRNEQIFAAENAPDGNPLKERDAALKSKFGVTLAGLKKDSLTEYVKALDSSGLYAFDFMLITAGEGVSLFFAGRLQDLSEAGINVTPDTPGVNGSLTEASSFGGKVSLVFCDVLRSDIRAAYCIAADASSGSAKAAVTAKKAAESAISGELTFSAFLELQKELGSDEDREGFVLPDGKAALALIEAGGGRIFTSGTDGLPAADISSSAFSKAYTAASALPHGSGDENGVFTVKKLGCISSGEGIIPLPKADKDAEYRSLTDVSAASVLAAPNGVRYGKRLSGLLAALCECSEGVRKSEIKSLAEISGQEYSQQCAEIIVKSECGESAAIFGWGNLDEYFGSGLLAGESLSELTSAGTCKDRLKTVSAAVRILSEKLG